MKTKLSLLFILLILLISAYVIIPRDVEETGDVSAPVVETDEETEREETDVLTESSCGGAGGAWNACGSACRLTPEDVCIDVCVEYCECQSDDQCPSGFTCGDFVEGNGVCL